MITALDGRVLWVEGDARTFFNYSVNSIVGRDVFSFVQRDRMHVKQTLKSVAPNVTIEKSLVLRPRERRPIVARVMLTRQADDQTVLWQFSSESR
jgi:hypothetical protein